jgi:hypothetical protein
MYLEKNIVFFLVFSYDYSAYDYQYDASTASAYPSYAGYESGASYAAPGTYEGYATSGAYPTSTRFK